MAATRRLAAVLAADLVGYSRLMGLDEEGTLARLRALRSEILDPKIAENSGRLVKTTGDGFLVEFNSVIDALRCGRDVHAAMARLDAPDPDRRFMLRIGIHQGDIVVEDGDIFGNGVNIAARLEGIAEPGGICVSERVQEDAAGRIDLLFEDIGEQQLKNIARPIRAYHARPKPPEVVPEPAAPSQPDPVPVAPAPQPEPVPVAPAPAPPTAAESPAIAAPPAAAPTAEPDLPPEPTDADEPVLFPFLAARFSLADHAREAAAGSPERLQALVAEWLGREVEIARQDGAWVSLSAADRIRLPIGAGSGAMNRLGLEATLGLRAWRAPGPLVIRIGPLDRASFDALLPGQPALNRLTALIRCVLGPAASFAINPILAGAHLAPLRLGGEPGAARRLGWDTWMPPASEAALPDADDALFPASDGPVEDDRAAAAAA